MPSIIEALKAARSRARSAPRGGAKSLVHGPPLAARSSYGRPITGTWSTDRAIDGTFKASVLVYRSVMGLASALGSVRWVAEVRKGDKWEPDEGHELQGLLNQPHAYFARQDFNEVLAMALALAGNALFQKTLLTRTLPGATRPVIGELTPLIPDGIEPIPHERDWLAGYRYNRNGVRKQWKAEEILHFMFRDPANMYWGLSPLKAAGDVIHMDIAAVRWNAESFENRAVSDGVFSTDQVLTADQHEELQDQVYIQHMGPRRGPPWVLGGGLKWDERGHTPVEMDFNEGRKMTREDVLSALGMPPVVAGYFENATLANAEVSRRIFWEDNVIPSLVERVAGGFNANVVPHFGDTAKLRVGYDISGIPALREDALKKAQLFRLYLTSGIPPDVAMDELEMDMPRLGPPYGNVPFGLELARRAAEAASAVPAEIDTPSSTPTADAAREGGARTPAQQEEVDEGKSLAPRAHEIKAGGPTITAGVFTTEIADAEADAFRRVFLAVLKALRGDVSLSDLRTALVAGDAAAVVSKLGGNGLDEALRAGLGSRLEATARRAALRSMADLEAQVGGGLKLDAGRIRRWLVPYLEERVGQLSSTTRAAVQETVAEWAAGKLGADADAAAELVRGSWGLHRQHAAGVRNLVSALLQQGKSPGAAVEQALKLARARLAERADTIAAYESISAANRGAIIPWEQAMDEGHVAGATLTWFTADDERVDEDCIALEGQEIRLGSGELFTTPSGTRIANPPAHAGCRCGAIASAITLPT